MDWNTPADGTQDEASRQRRTKENRSRKRCRHPQKYLTRTKLKNYPLDFDFRFRLIASKPKLVYQAH